MRREAESLQSYYLAMKIIDMMYSHTPQQQSGTLKMLLVELFQK